MILRRAILVVLLALTPLITFAQSAGAPLDGKARAEVVEKIAHAFETMYVVPEKGTALAKDFRARLAHGDYDSAATPQELAEALTRDLHAANDRHLGVRVGEPTSPADADAAEAEEDRLSNYGFRRLDRLEGNIGYLDVSGFLPGPESERIASGGMAFLANSDAIIVDLRRCPGGATQAVDYLASYFFPPDKRVLMNHYDRPSNRSMASPNVNVPGKRLPNTALYLLTSSTSASACEAFAYLLQQWGRASVVGERTAGAGYHNTIVPVGHHLLLSISVGTAIHPKTNKGWEAAGVEPDIVVAAGGALDAARAAALRNLLAKGGSAAQKRSWTIALQLLGKVSAGPLEDYVGTYGNKEISIRDGSLYYQRAGGRGGVLRPIDRDAFDLNGDAIVRFVRGADGKVARLRLEWPGHPTEELVRAP